MKPRWVPKSAVLAMHEMLLAEHGGMPGLISEALLDSALASPANLLSYGKPDLFDLAAKYAASLTLNHPFQDGNKRVALTVAGVFLELNGARLESSEADAVRAMLALSVRTLDEPAFAAWLRMNSSSPRATRRRASSARRQKGAPRKKR